MFDHPLLLLVLGTLLVAGSSAVWLQTRDRRAAWAVAVCLTVSVGGLVVERLSVTPTEQVRSTLRRLVRDLKANDKAAVLDHLLPAASGLRDEAEHWLDRVQIQSVSIKPNLKITTRGGNDGASAEARFNVTVTASTRAGRETTRVVPRFLVVRFRRDHGQWRVRDYQAFEPIRRQSLR